ncbi:MAG: TonB-dependent receptor [Burkholderiales bacterium]
MQTSYAQTPASNRAPLTIEPIEVIGTTPTPGFDVPRDRIPANVRVFDTRDFRDAPSLSLPDFMARQLPSVNLNEIQGNPLQSSVNYRGFQASPLLGAPQGLSVYQDGVRINESFGDLVHWDLIPRNAISSMTLLPGSNPLFGLNTLGGAISLRTKRGDTHVGTHVEAEGGSFGRRMLALEHGGFSDNTALYVAATRFSEDGWRDHSPSDATQLFGKLTHRDARHDLHLSLTHGDTDLTGNGLVPESMQRQSRTRVFTVPDNTRNQMNMLTINGGLWTSDDTRLSGTLYHRRNRTSSLNSDVNPGFENDATLDGSTGANAGAGFDRSTGNRNRLATMQRTTGVNLQWSLNTSAHNLAVGFAHDRGDSEFTQHAGAGIFDVNRAVLEAIPGGALLRNRIRGLTRASGVFASETYAIAPRMHLTASARYNHMRVALQDLRVATPPNLDGDYRYRKLNPALGLTWGAAESFTTYVGFSQGNRAPSPIELGCADRANPCTLPNAMASDPFLKQVLARTYEAGVRGKISASINWNAGVYRTDNRDDILFVGTTGSAGFFTNYGATRRQGLELGINAKQTRWDWEVNYSLLRASFESAACLLAANNSSRGQSPECASPGDDLIRVNPGNRIPGLPEHNLKLTITTRTGPTTSIGADLGAFSRQYARGNENNLHQPGTITQGGTARTFLGSGTTPGYAVLNLNVKHELERGWELFGKITNLFDRRYQSGAALAENPFDNSGRFQTNSDNWARETFVAPGAPRAGWIGLRYQFAAARNR